MRHRDRTLWRAVAIGVAALTLLGAAACGDDGDDGDEGSSDRSTTTVDDETTTTEETGPTVTVPRDDSLESRLPELDGYEREESENSFNQQRCDGEKFTVDPASQANYRYTRDGNRGTLVFVGLSFADATAASAFYDEFVISATACVGEGQEVLEPEPIDVGDEGLLFPVETNGDATGGFLVARKGPEMWFLSSDRSADGAPVSDELVQVFTQTVG